MRSQVSSGRLMRRRRLGDVDAGAMDEDVEPTEAFDDFRRRPVALCADR